MTKVKVFFCHRVKDRFTDRTGQESDGPEVTFRGHKKIWDGFEEEEGGRACIYMSFPTWYMPLTIVNAWLTLYLLLTKYIYTSSILANIFQYIFFMSVV